ncbi:MAG TPA: nuclear transport factor 2 family protein [Actinomycetota bacterium]
MQDREALIDRLVAAYGERDFSTIEDMLSEEVVLHIPGASPFAGEHHGRELVARLAVGLRRFLDTGGRELAYEHQGDVTIASQHTGVHGPKHAVEMDFRVAMHFDPEGRLSAVFLQPSDQGLFDHVIGAALLGTALDPDPGSPPDQS